MKNRIATIFVLVVFTAGTVQVEAQVTSGQPTGLAIHHQEQPIQYREQPLQPEEL